MNREDRSVVQCDCSKEVEGSGRSRDAELHDCAVCGKRLSTSAAQPIPEGL